MVRRKRAAKRKERKEGVLLLKNVRCFENAQIPLDDHITVIVGENGSGKSTIIEALSGLSYGEAGIFEQFSVRGGGAEAEIRLRHVTANEIEIGFWRRTEGERDYLKQLRREKYLFAYGRYRRVISPQLNVEARSLSPAGLLDELASHAHTRRTVTVSQPDNNLLQDISRYIVALEFGRKSDSRLQRVWQEITAVLPQIDPNLSGLQIDEEDQRLVPRFLHHNVGLELRQLSDGYQSFLVIIFDLALRYRYLFDIDNPLEGKAIVGIDEVDLHLHPRWQRKVLGQLAALFPNTQFIVTTHSPVIAQAAIDSKYTIIALKRNDGIVIPEVLSKNLVGRLRGAEVGSVLLEDRLFGVESRYSIKFSDIEQKVDELQDRIVSEGATDKDLRQLSSALTELEKLVAREDERRADSSTVAQMARLETAFVKDLAEELRKVNRDSSE